MQTDLRRPAAARSRPTSIALRCRPGSNSPRPRRSAASAPACAPAATACARRCSTGCRKTCTACASSTPAAARARSRWKRRGVARNVVAIDLSPSLVDVAVRPPRPAPRRVRQRRPHRLQERRHDVDAALGEFDYVVAMDSLIHYETADAVRVLAGLVASARARSLLFTFAPSNPAAARDPRRRPPVPAQRPRAVRSSRWPRSALYRQIAADRRLQGLCSRRARCAFRAASTRRRRWS